MGWLWGSGDSSAANNNLDPSLRDFLHTEAPSGPKPSLPSRPAAPPAASPAPPAQTASPEQHHTAPAVPPQSLFPDGRYAHLWKNYTPQNVLDDRGKTEQDKLRDIVDAFNDRKAAIGRAALENCALEYLAQYECFQKPGWVQTATLCRAESRTFNRCYEMQAKFLKALGYLTMDARSPEQDEIMQMHADKLYQQLKEQEALIDKAKEDGRPIPAFESVLSRQNVARAVAGKPLSAHPTAQPITDRDDEEDIWSQIKPSSRDEYEKKLAELPLQDQEIERKALLGELRAQAGMSKQVEGTFIEERINRMKRREAGQETIGDTIKRLWGWG
ncbi:hypothetical protein K505DRAFT_358726 [Melanomma pulvis-pyrius CBS 109.77]|uniref:Autophagy protein n=1 Tax=Melanomma pulvis-pyrius CBS 109.77 TaxID=1314802 RepID=A0A6A6XKJ4_9PLEO|nr:hypothetical protein K505DRAFT_358726 [Melanomma pulvis-pyrius CBS 109.77]